MADEVKETEAVEDETTLHDDDRDAIYKEFVEAEKKPAEAAEPPVTEEKKEEAAEAPAETKEPEPAAEAVEPVKEEVAQPVKAEKIETAQKMVPLDALHEERSKHKETKRRIQELESQMALLLERAKAAPAKEAEDGEEITDYDATLKAQRQQIKFLEGKIAAFERDFQTERQTREQVAIQGQMMTTAQELEAEGFPGFTDFEPNVANELLRLWNEDPDNNLIYPNNPQGWKKVYREMVYPKLRKVAGGLEAREILDEKKAAKVGATTVRSTGSAVKTPVKKDVTWTYDDYLNMRGHNQG